MKGKHQRTRRHRRDQALTDRLERLKTELEAETVRATAARHSAALTHTARARLARERTQTERQLRASEREAAQLVANTAHVNDTITAAVRELRTVQRELSIISAENDIDQFWKVGLRTCFPEHQPRPEPTFVKTWYRHRTGRELNPTRTLSLAGWVPDEIPNDRATFAPYVTSTVHDTTPQACWAWAIPPWMALPDGTDAAERRAQLGSTSTGRPTLTAEPYPRPLRRGATITTPWRHPPVVGQVSDAVDLAYWYHRSAITQGWHPDQQAVPFWLPAEHSTAYPQAQTLPDGTDLRLPHPLVFAAFASPWRIEAMPGRIDAALNALLFYARGRAARNSPESMAAVLGRLQATDIADRADLPTPLQLLDRYGGTVEGLLLTANADATPADDFAWCLAIYHPCGFPLGRIAVPASRATTQWRQQVDNIIAGIALSSWHQPPDPAAPTERTSGFGPGTEQDPNVVRILDIDTTSPGATRDDNDRASVRASRPHLRRGHWRHQRTGPQRHELRWTWVRATAVNAATVATNQVYVLR